jgi:hypothetical protein
MPAVSQAQRGLFGAAYSAKKAGKPKPKFVPQSIWNLDLTKMEDFLSMKKVTPEKSKWSGYLKRRSMK